jgi:hypothetical protein
MDSFKAHGGKEISLLLTLDIENLFSDIRLFLFPCDEIIAPLILLMAISNQYYILYSNINIQVVGFHHGKPTI